MTNNTTFYNSFAAKTSDFLVFHKRIATYKRSLEWVEKTYHIIRFLAAHMKEDKVK